MKLRSFLPVLAVSAGALAFAGLAQDEHLLRLELKPNTVSKYKLSIVSNQKIDAPGAPSNIDVSGTMDLDISTLSLDEKGLADIEMKTTNIKFDAGDMAGTVDPDQIPKEMVVKGKLDDRYRLSQAQAIGAKTSDAQMLMSMAGSSSTTMFVELPEKTIKVGDSWTFNMPKNPMTGDKEHALTATLVSLKNHHDVPVYEIAFKGNAIYDVNLSEAMKKASQGGGGGGMVDMIANMDAKLKGNIEIEGSSLIARQGGKTQFQTMKMTAKNIVNVMGMDIPIDGVTTFEMKLAP
jgi:hypothetical protein